MMGMGMPVQAVPTVQPVQAQAQPGLQVAGLQGSRISLISKSEIRYEGCLHRYSNPTKPSCCGFRCYKKDKPRCSSNANSRRLA